MKTGGELVVIRRPQFGVTVKAEDFLPCKFCYGFIYQDQLKRHVKHCKLRSDCIEDEGSSGVIKQGELLYPNKTAVEGSSVELEEFVLRVMENDHIASVVKTDSLLLQYGSFLLCGKGAKRPSDISQSMRIIARLLIKLREKDKKFKEYSLTDFLCPKYFDLVVECTKDLAGYLSKNNDGERLPVFETPSLALKIGYGLDNILMLLHGVGIRKGNE